MTTTYRRTNTDSGLTGGTDFTKAILDAANDAAGSTTINTNAGATKAAAGVAYTDVGVPGAGGAAGDHSHELEVTSGNTNIQLSAWVGRVNSSGTLQAESSQSAEQTANAGTLVFSFTNPSLGTWAEGDRLRWRFQTRNTHSHSGQSITVSHGGANNEVVAPWTSGAPVVVTPGTVALTTATFAPTVTASDHKTVTPGTVALTTATFAPTVSVSDNQTVTPGVLALSTATFAPTVTATANQTVTPGVASLTLTTFAPTVTGGAGLTVTPPTASLTTATFAPSVAITDHKTVTPSTASLSLTTFAPTVTGGSGLTVIPGTASLETTRFAPTVAVTDHKLVTPGNAVLTLSLFVPSISVSGSGIVCGLQEVQSKMAKQARELTANGWKVNVKRCWCDNWVEAYQSRELTPEGWRVTYTPEHCED